MNLKLGDLVVRKKNTSNLLFQITEFDGDKVVIRGVKVPVITVVNKNELIKINKKNRTTSSILKVIE